MIEVNREREAVYLFGRMALGLCRKPKPLALQGWVAVYVSASGAWTLRVWKLAVALLLSRRPARVFVMWPRDRWLILSRVGLGLEARNGTVYCAACGEEAEWEDCWGCGGEGLVDAYELDPINCIPGEVEDCGDCGGQGGRSYCEHADCATGEIMAMLPLEEVER